MANITTFADGSSLNRDTGAVTHAPSTPAPAVAEPEVLNRENLLGNIQSTAQGKGSEQANEAFIQGVAKYAHGRAASKEELGAFGATQFGLQGATVQQVIDRFGIGGEIEGFNIQAPEAITEEAPAAVVEPEQPVQTSNVESIMENIIAKKTTDLGEKIDTTEMFAAKQEAARDVELGRQAIRDKKLIDAEQLETIGDRPIAMTFINRQKAGYTAGEYITNLKMVQDYNNNLILSKMAEGNFIEAMQYNQEIANDQDEIYQLMIDQALEQDRITEEESADLKAQSEFERDMALDGFLKIPSPDQLAGLTEEQIIRIPNDLTGGIDIYKKPTEYADIPTQVVKGAGGRSLLINTQTGETIRDFGMASRATGGGGGSTPKPRTFIKDRNALIGAGLSDSDIDNIEENLRNGFNLDEIIGASNFSTEQGSAVRGQFIDGGEPGEITPEDAEIIISSAVDEDGNLDVTKIPSDVRVEVLQAGREAGMFDEDDEDTKNWLQKAVSFINPFD